MKGMTHIYTGDGKGKTTAALGLALRCAGRGGKALIVQFFKGRDTGELHTLSQIPAITVLRLEKDYGFFHTMDDSSLAEVTARHNALLQQAIDSARQRTCSLLVLDEIISAYNCGAVDCGAVDDLLQNKPPELELVLTGRDAPPAMINAADYVTEMRKIKHPFDQGLPAREGVEY